MEIATLSRVQKLHHSRVQTRSSALPDVVHGGMKSHPLLRATSLALACIAIVTASHALAGSSPELDVQGMTFVASRENDEAVILYALRARFDTQAKKAYLKDVNASVPPNTERSGFKMRCDEGVVDLASNDFEATGNVNGEAEGGERFEAEWVRYDHSKGVLYTSAPVVMTNRGTTVIGGGFNYNIAERRFQLLGGARLVQDVKEGVGR